MNESTLNEIIESLKEDLQEVRKEIQQLENKTYKIDNDFIMLQDRKRVERLKGQEEYIRITISRFKRIYGNS